MLLSRFIVACFHPTNAQLQSNLVTRWALIGWLWTSAKVWRAGHGGQGVSDEFHSTTTFLFQSDWGRHAVCMSLFLDWIYFNPEADNLMNLGMLSTVISSALGKFVRLF